jgi:hypothetical protein
LLAFDNTYNIDFHCFVSAPWHCIQHHMKSSIRAKNGPQMARSSPQRAISKRAGESKADARYWQQGNRLQLHDSAEYSARFQVAGNRE